MELVLRVVFSLAAVLGLMWFLARVASWRIGGGHASVVRLIGRQSLGRTSSVAVVAVGERMLVLGVTEAGVRLLAELDDDEIDVPPHARHGARGDDLTSEATLSEPGLLPQGSVLSARTWRQAWQSATTKGSPQA